MKKLFAVLALVPVAACAQAPQPVQMSTPKLDLTKPDARCGDLMYFDLGSMTDGPAYYVRTDGTVVGRCGGLLRGNHGTPDSCPPAGWTCPMPDVATIYEQHRQTKR
jgi:hypothetical protein